MTRAFDHATKAALTPESRARRDDWVRRVTALVGQIRQWAQEAGWPVEVGQETIEEPLLGRYDAPAARVSLPRGDLPERAVLVIPIALELLDGPRGRVDVEGYPTLSRVKLLGDGAGGWTIMTDSNVPLRLPWTAETFRQLARDLVA